MSDEIAPEVPMTVEERLTYLEEQNEGLKRVGKLLLALCILTGGLLAWTQMGSRKAVYSESVIFGDGSSPRGTLTTTPTGHLAFLFYDHLGILPPDPQFGAIPYLDGFAIYDRSGKPRIVIGINDKDQPVIDIVSPEGKVLFSALPPTEGSSTGTSPTEGSSTGTPPTEGSSTGTPPASTPVPVATPATP